MTPRFTGFPREMPGFLLGLAFHNGYDSLEENKAKYQKYITEPLRALYGELLSRFEQSLPELRIETRPHRCISGMYNDMRFSKGRQPLKEYLYLRFKLLAAGNTDIPGFYFDMGAVDYSYGIRFYNQTAAGVRALKETILSHETEFLQLLDEHQLMRQFALRGTPYLKDPYPQIPEPLHGWLSLRSLCLHKTQPIGEQVFTRGLLDELAAACGPLGGLLFFLQQKGASRN